MADEGPDQDGTGSPAAPPNGPRDCARTEPPADLVDMLYDCAYTRSVEIEWDAKKAASNLRKHGIDFADVALVFEDDLALTRQDLHSHHEERFVTLGCDPQGRLMVVVTPGAESAFA